MEKQRERSWIIHFICILSVLSVFAVSALVLMNVGVGVYKNIALGNAENFKLRTSLSYIASRIRQCDREDSIYLIEKEGVTVLILDEVIEGTKYETLLYFYDGKLYELFQEKGTSYELSSGMDIIEMNSLSFDMLSEKLIKVVATNHFEEQEEMLINIRTR